jgi:DNA invertase Pin-like site-specific DNA recombinase
MVHILAAVAEQETEAIVKRTKAAFAAAKGRVRSSTASASRLNGLHTLELQRPSAASEIEPGPLGASSDDYGPQATGAGWLHAIATELNAHEIPTPRRLGEVSGVKVERMMERQTPAGGS